MHRPASIKSPQVARKPVSIAVERVFPESGPGRSAAGTVPAAVIPRVRDGLVLRVVGKKKKHAVKGAADERRAR